LMACPSSRSNCFMRSSSCKGITSFENPFYTNLKARASPKQDLGAQPEPLSLPGRALRFLDVKRD
jgi:hypothetical protein